MTYEGIGWENSPSKKTPLNAENLNTMDRVIVFDNGIIQKLITGTHEGGKSISGTAVVHYSDTQNLKQKLDSVDEAIDHSLKDDTTQIELKSGTKTNTLNAGGMSVVDSNVRANKLTASNSFKVENTYSGAKSTELTENGLVLQNRSDYTNTLATESGMEKNAFTMLPKEGGLLATAESVDDLATNVENLKVLGYTIPKECPIQNEKSNGKLIQKVGRVALGSLDWTYGTQSGVNCFSAYIRVNSDISSHCKYTQVKSWASSVFVSGTYRIATDAIKINDSAYSTAESFKSAMQNEWLFYELETPITHSIENTIINDDLKMLGWTTPPQMPIQNYTSNGIFHQRVGRVDLGSLNFERPNDYFQCIVNINSKAYSVTDVANAYSKAYTLKDANSQTTNKIDKSISMFDGSAVDGKTTRIRIFDSTYNTAESFKQAMSGTYLYYELSTEQTKSVDGNEIALEPTFFCGVDTNEGYKQYNGCHIYVDASGYAYIESGSVNIARFQAEKLL